MLRPESLVNCFGLEQTQDSDKDCIYYTIIEATIQKYFLSLKVKFFMKHKSVFADGDFFS